MTRRPNLAARICVYAALIVLVAIVLYPVMLVCKKAFEPGPNFALSASPVPHAVTLGHFRTQSQRIHLYNVHNGRSRREVFSDAGAFFLNDAVEWRID